ALMKAYDAKKNPNVPAPAVPVAQVVAPAAPAPVAPVVANAMTPEEDALKVAAKARLERTASMREAAAAELNRQQTINTLCVKHPLIAAKAIEDNWDAAKTEIAVLKASLQDTHRAPAGHIKSSAPVGTRVL